MNPMTGWDFAPGWGSYGDPGLAPSADIVADVPIGVPGLSIDVSG